MTSKALQGGAGFLQLELPVEVWLASEQVQLGRLLELEPGGVLKLARDPDLPVDLVVNGAVVARGELVVVGSSFGFRVTETVQQTLAGIEEGTSPTPAGNGGEAGATASGEGAGPAEPEGDGE